MARVVVVGAGVSGLTTALVLAKTGRYVITVVAEHMPGDYSINYASPWAGANVLPYSTPGTANNRYEAATWPIFAQFAKELPEAGVHFQDAYEYVRTRDSDTPVGLWVAELVKKDPWFKDLMPNFRNLAKEEVPSGYDGGSTFTSVCINTALYLPWLASQCLKHDVKIKRGIITHIAEAMKLSHDGHPADLVINCTGLSSLYLGGVEDKTVYPGRGQIVIVSNDPGGIMAGTTGTDDHPEEMTYIMHRAAGGGTVIGGCLQADKWESQPDPNMAVRIMQRAIEVCPSLVPKGKGIEGLQVIRHSVGLRPMRKDGIRVEKEVISADGRQVPVVHNYGHGGYGYQTSWGAAAEAQRLVKAALGVNARL